MDDEARYVARWELDGVSGVVVAVDVLRAFTTAAYAFAAGAASIWLVGTVDEALTFGRALPGSLVMGEEHGRRPAGFDLSNSPVDISHADVDGRILVQRTSAGTQGVIGRAYRLPPLTMRVARLGFGACHVLRPLVGHSPRSSSVFVPDHGVLERESRRTGGESARGATGAGGRSAAEGVVPIGCHE